MHNEADNPYAPSASDVQVASHPFFWMRVIVYVHLVAIVASVFVVSSEVILSNRVLEFLIALPIFFTAIVCPIAMLIAAIGSTQEKMLVRGLAVCLDLALSGIQWMIWLPTFQ